MFVCLLPRLPAGPLAAVERARSALDGDPGCVLFLMPAAKPMIVLVDISMRLPSSMSIRDACGSVLTDLILVEDDRWRSVICQAPCCSP